jgi:hypothetical protein
MDRLHALDRRLGLDAASGGWGTRPVLVTAIVIVSIVFLIPAAAAVWNGYHDRRVAAQLRAEGAETTAEILDADHKRRLRAVAGERIELRFQTEDGEEIRTWVTVQDATDSGKVRIRYLRSKPSVARLVDDPAPRSGWWPVVSGLLFPVGLFSFGYAGFRRHHRRAGAPH